MRNRGAENPLPLTVAAFNRTFSGRRKTKIVVIGGAGLIGAKVEMVIRNLHFVRALYSKRAFV